MNMTCLQIWSSIAYSDGCNTVRICPHCAAPLISSRQLVCIAQRVGPVPPLAEQQLLAVPEVFRMGSKQPGRNCRLVFSPFLLFSMLPCTFRAPWRHRCALNGRGCLVETQVYPNVHRLSTLGAPTKLAWHSRILGQLCEDGEFWTTCTDICSYKNWRVRYTI